jgi:hypothetical protein
MDRSRFPTCAADAAAVFAAVDALMHTLHPLAAHIAGPRAAQRMIRVCAGRPVAPAPFAARR